LPGTAVDSAYYYYYYYYYYYRWAAATVGHDTGVRDRIICSQCATAITAKLRIIKCPCNRKQLSIISEQIPSA